jgi:hypothetical protein
VYHKIRAGKLALLPTMSAAFTSMLRVRARARGGGGGLRVGGEGRLGGVVVVCVCVCVRGGCGVRSGARGACVAAVLRRL